MNSWAFTLAVKMVTAPLVMFGYWLVAIRIPAALKRYVPDGRVKEMLFRERYLP